MTRPSMPAGSIVWVLLVSLALNLFFGGWIGARAARDQWSGQPQQHPSMRIEQLAETLPASDAERLRAQFKTDGDAIGTARAEFRQAQEAVRNALRAKPYDAVAFDRATQTMRERRVVLEVMLHRALSSAAAEMSPEGRTQLAQWPPQH